MDTIQARLWRGIVADLGRLDIYDRFEPPKSKELKNLYYELCENFSSTLTDSQQKAFKKLSNISNALFSDNQDTGIVLGIYVAIELQNFLSHPEKSLQEASNSYLPVSKMMNTDIQALNEYFIKYGRQGGVSNE